MEQPVTYERRGAVALITLNRPEARNAIDGALTAALEAAIDRLEDDAGVWVGVLAANGPTYSAGADLKAVQAGEGPRMSTERGGPGGFIDRERTKPVIAAVEGAALGGGFELVLTCDLVVAGSDAQFGLPEVKRSLLAGAGGLYRLPRRIPRNVALELALTGRPMDAARAERLGLVSVLCEPGGAVAAAVSLGEVIAENAPLAVQASRRVLIDGLATDEPTARAKAEEEVAHLATTADFAEGTAAFVQKRAPIWAGG